MKNFHRAFCAFGLSASLALGGCASTGTATSVSTTTTDITSTIAAVQQAAVTACSFLPTTSTIANIIGTLAGVGTETATATSIAAQICSAVSATKSSKRGSSTPTVNGVVIHGKFVSN